MEKEDGERKLTQAQQASKDYWAKELPKQKARKEGTRGKPWDWRKQGVPKDSPNFAQIKANRDRTVAAERKAAGRMQDLVETESIEPDTIFESPETEEDDMGDASKSIEDLAKKRSSYKKKPGKTKRGRKSAKTKRKTG